MTKKKNTELCDLNKPKFEDGDYIQYDTFLERVKAFEDDYNALSTYIFRHVLDDSIKNKINTSPGGDFDIWKELPSANIEGMVKYDSRCCKWEKNNKVRLESWLLSIANEVFFKCETIYLPIGATFDISTECINEINNIFDKIGIKVNKDKYGYRWFTDTENYKRLVILSRLSYV